MHRVQEGNQRFQKAYAIAYAVYGGIASHGVASKKIKNAANS